MKTEQEAEEEQKGLDRMKQLEAAKPWYKRASDAYWETRDEHRAAFWVILASAAISIAAYIIKSCGHG